MQPVKKILVGLDGSEMDQTLIQFVSYIMRSSPAEDIYFMNVVKNLDDTSFSRPEIKKFGEEAVKAQKQQIESEIDAILDDDHKAKVHAIVKVGPAFREFLKFINSESIDIVILGNKKNSHGSGTLNQRLARRAPCNLVVIPEGHTPQLSKLLLPIDFSDYSKQALEYAIYISRSNDNQIELICQYIYEVPSGYHYSGKSFEEFAEVMKKNAQKQFKQWVSKIDTEGIKITPVYCLDENEDFGQIVKGLALQQKVSGIIIGAKGRSATSAIFIGSTAEKLISAIDYLPLTIVRPKGVTAGLIESISEL